MQQKNSAFREKSVDITEPGWYNSEVSRFGAVVKCGL